MQTTRQEALTQLTGKGQQTTKREKRSDGARIYYTLATNEMIPYEPKDHGSVRGGLNTVVNSTSTFAPIAAHRTRKAFAALVEVLIKRGLLSQEELDEILLAAVDYQEMGPAESDAGRLGR